MGISILLQDSFFHMMPPRTNYLLHERFTPATILEPRSDAPHGKIWCRHCRIYLLIGAESVSHQNLVRQSQACMQCGGWNYLDEGIEVQHLGMCAFPNGDWVKLTMGGGQQRATRIPYNNVSQEEAASWPHV
jgi:hypothetical protein